MTYNISKVFVDFLPPLLSKQLPCFCELGVSDLPNPYSSCKTCGGQGSNILGWSRAHQGRRWAPLVGNPHVSHSLRGRTSPSLPATSFTHLAPTLPSRPLASSHRPGFFWHPLFQQGWGLEVLHGGTRVPMGDSGQEPVAHGEFISEDLSPRPSVKGFLVLWGVWSHCLESVQTWWEDDTAMKQERVWWAHIRLSAATALDRKGVFLSSHKAHGQVSELPKPQ